MQYTSEVEFHCVVLVVNVTCPTFSYDVSSIFIIALSFFFFFKQKTAYEMPISDWSSDVCSSDLDLLLGVVPATLQSNWYLLTATAAAIGGMLLSVIFQRVNGVIVALDALVIGLFGAFGTSKALGLGLAVVPAVFVGVCAAVVGSVLRDVLMGLPVAIMHVGSLYAVAAGAGCELLATADALGAPLLVAAIAGIEVTTVIRIQTGRASCRERGCKYV